jgi:hypothetical protein
MMEMPLPHKFLLNQQGFKIYKNFNVLFLWKTLSIKTVCQLGYSSVIECLLSIRKALGLIPSTAKMKTK